MENDNKNGFRKRWIWLIIAACMIFLTVLAISLNARGNAHVGVTNYPLRTEKNPSALRIAQISDFHNDQKLGEDLVKKTKEQHPDVIVLTGDLIDRNRTDIPYALSTASKLTDIAPVYYVTGNHEYSIPSCDDFKQSLTEVGVNVLEGTGVELDRGFWVYGVNDPSAYWDHDESAEYNMRYLLSSLKIDKDDYNILLSHRPEAFSAYSDFDLVLTGHAHGGQVRLPFIGGIIAPNQGLFPKYDAGTYKTGMTTMIVSRGIGNSLCPVRVNDPPELVIVDINR